MLTPPHRIFTTGLGFRFRFYPFPRGTTARSAAQLLYAKRDLLTLLKRDLLSIKRDLCMSPARNPAEAGHARSSLDVSIFICIEKYMYHVSESER